MNTDNKKILQEASRWIRVGFLAISVLGPVINTVSSRLRERSAALQVEAAKRGNIVAERGEKVGRDLAARGNKVTQGAVERGNDVLQDLAERSEKASRELAKRTEQVSKEITQRGKKVSKEVSKRSKKATKELQKRSQTAQRELAKRAGQLTQQNSQQTNPLWMVFGFGTGLAAAGVAIYLLIKKRMEQYAQDNQHMHISQNGSLNGTGIQRQTPVAETRSVSQSSLSTKAVEPDSTPPALTLVNPVTDSSTVEPEIEDSESATEKMPIISIQASIDALPTIEEETSAEAVTSSAPIENATVEQPVGTSKEQQAIQDTPPAISTDAMFLGVVSTKVYYPVETPLNTLRSSEDDALDVVYFATADDAKAQGYAEAE